MSTIKINELATSAISATDFIAKADTSGLATKNTIQALSNFVSSATSLGFKGVLLSTDVAVTQDGIYVAGDTGTYTNNGGLVVSVTDQIVLISVTETQTVFEQAIFPISLTIDTIPTLGSTNAVESGSVADEFEGKEIQLSKQMTITYKSGTITTNVAIGELVDFTITENTSAKHSVIDCVEGDVFYLRGAGGNSPRLWAFLDVDDKLISISTTNLDTYNSPLTLIAPSGTYKAVFNTFINNYPDAFILKLEPILKDIDSKILIETNERIEQDVIIESKVDDLSRLLLKEIPLNLIQDSYISRTTKILVANNDYKYVEPLLLSSLGDNLFVSIGNQGGSVSQIHWLSGGVINEANFVSSQIEGVNGTDEQLIKIKLIKPTNATHIAFSSLASYDIKLYRLVTDAEFTKAINNTFPTIHLNSLLSNSLGINPFNSEATFLQKRASNLMSFSNGEAFFFNDGQSNTDRRVPYADAPSWFTALNGKIDNYMVWNPDTNQFQSYESGVFTGASTPTDTRWGYDIIFAKLWLDANPNKKIYSYTKSLGGTSINEGSNSAASWQPKVELIPIAKRKLCDEVIEEVKQMVLNCVEIGLQLNILFRAVAQGESDADLGQTSVDAFLQNRKNLTSFMRGIFMTPTLPVINLQVKESTANPLYVQINNHLATISNEDSNHFVIEMQSQDVLDDGYTAHWDADAMIYAGGKIYDKYLELNPTY